MLRGRLDEAGSQSVVRLGCEVGDNRANRRSPRFGLQDAFWNTPHEHLIFDRNQPAGGDLFGIEPLFRHEPDDRDLAGDIERSQTRQLPIIQRHCRFDQHNIHGNGTRCRLAEFDRQHPLSIFPLYRPLGQ